MQLELDTGRVSFDEFGLIVGSVLTRPRFLRHAVATACRVGPPHGPWTHYQLPPLPTADTELHVVLHFHRERLATVELLHHADRFCRAGEAWTEAGEIARREFAERWLVETLGAQCGRFPWGEIVSNPHTPTSASTISIWYRGPNAWQKVGRTAGRLWGEAMGQSK